MHIQIQFEKSDDELVIWINDKTYIADSGERKMLIELVGLDKLKIENVIPPPSMPREVLEWFGGARFIRYPRVDISHLADKFEIQDRIVLKNH